MGVGQLLPRLLRRELPIDARAGCIPLALPRGNFDVEDGTISDAPIKALPAQDAGLDLHHNWRAWACNETPAAE